MEADGSRDDLNCSLTGSARQHAAHQVASFHTRQAPSYGGGLFSRTDPTEMNSWSIPPEAPTITLVEPPAHGHGEAGRGEWALLYAFDENHLFAGPRPVFHQQLIEKLAEHYGETHRWLSGMVGGPFYPDQPVWFAATDVAGMLTAEEVSGIEMFLLPAVRSLVGAGREEGDSAGNRLRFG